MPSSIPTGALGGSSLFGAFTASIGEEMVRASSPMPGARCATLCEEVALLALLLNCQYLSNHPQAKFPAGPALSDQFW